ncbi:hypothetical protein ABHF33_16660 [Chitinibacter sp. FCG-7]|uniref:Uncharacterized protein n=1 Tax=Chitinibacter mangrovi TaxID=3153927 RepID=A0AAU7FA23_9NEIS
MFKKIRILVLVLILAWVALDAMRTENKAQAWESSQYIYLHPVFAGLDEDTMQYIKTQNTEQWQDIEQFFKREGESYGLKLGSPVRVFWGEPIKVAPPQLAAGGSMFNIMLWSLQLRWWAWRHTPNSRVKPDARIYMLYHPAENGVALPHSVGIAKARLGLAHLFASEKMHGSNQVVVTHELLHIYGANDHYDPANNQPLFPQGFAEPDLEPRFPQRLAEIMAGRIPLDESKAEMPKSLRDVLMGAETAKAIGWVN